MEGPGNDPVAENILIEEKRSNVFTGQLFGTSWGRGLER